jgi:hypothetical protein
MAAVGSTRALGEPNGSTPASWSRESWAPPRSFNADAAAAISSSCCPQARFRQ